MTDEIKAPLDQGETRDMTVVKIVLGFVPLVGGALAEVAGCVNDNLSRRQEHWMLQVTAAINDLQRKLNISVEQLMQSERFTSFLLQATPIALKNHQQAKIEALKNALFSVGELEFSNEDLAFQYLRYIDELTVSHLGILHAISKNEDAFKEVRSMEAAFQMLTQEESPNLSLNVMRAYIRDLDYKGLINAADLEDLPEFESKAGYVAKEQSARNSLKVTNMGAEFLSFVSQR
ncbi:hypothetical protein [Limnohabitans sp. JirII-29]|uniref:hypothetical protein n=1 Tax=Limnohabitans sp. JirII-29 TaxID=1835756 RepID=UPI0011B1E512|nr:hypothetical protein [Limnohabitans sp. JirII-29]